MSGVKRSEGATRRGSARERARSRFGSTTAEAYVSEFTDELLLRVSSYFLVAPSTTGSIYGSSESTAAPMAHSAIDSCSGFLSGSHHIRSAGDAADTTSSTTFKRKELEGSSWPREKRSE